MSSYWPFIVPGLVSGAIYSLLAVGVVLTYQTTGVLNFAFGAQAYASAVIYYDLRTDAGWPTIPSVILAGLIAAPVLGFLLERMVFRYLRASPVTTRLVVGIGMATALPAVVSILTGGNKERLAPPPIVFERTRYYQWGSLNIDSDQIGVIATSAVVLLALGVVMRYTDVGLRMRSVVESGRLSELHGVSAPWVNTLAWLISSTLAGLAGVMLAPIFPAVSPIQYTLLLMAALAAAVFARLRSLTLTVVGAMLTGVGQNLIIKWLDLSGALATGLRPSFPFILLFVLLLVTPSLKRLTRANDPMAGVDPPPALAQGNIAKFPGSRLQQTIAAIVVLGGMLLLNDYWSTVFARAALMSIVFLSLMLLTGQGGFLSLCTAAFVGVGGFVAAQLAIEQGMSIMFGAVVGGLVAAAGGFLLSLPTLRLGELPLALATFGFGLLCSNMVFNQTWAFGSSGGLFPPRPKLGPIDFKSTKSFFLLTLVLLVLVMLLCRRLVHGTTGRFATALRGSETAAASIGINAVPLRIAIFTLSAGMAGFAGGLLGSLQRVVEPNAFTSGASMYWLVIVVVVGVYTIRGAVASGIVFVLVPEIVSHLPAQMQLLQFALFGLGVVLLAKHPEGALEYLLATPGRLRERTRLLGGELSDEEKAAAVDAALAAPWPEPDPVDAPVHVLKTTADERLARRTRRRELTIEAARLRVRIPTYPIKFLYFVTAAFVIDALSRSLLGTVWEDIRRDFGLQDSALGPLNAAYSIVAALSVIPFGRLTDKRSRVKLVAFGFVPWSLAMMWQALAPAFAMMFVARLFLGSIEGTNGPATPSLLGDYYPMKRRNRVFGIFGVGAALGGTLGILLGGTLATSLGWRGTFFIVGILGLLIGAILLKSLREPERGLQDALYRIESEIEAIDRQEELERHALDDPEHASVILSSTSKEEAHQRDLAVAEAASSGGPSHDYRTVSTAQGIRLFLHNRTLTLLLAGQVATDFFLGILGLWAVTFFRRYHSLTAAGASGVVSLLSIAVIVGTVHAGRVGDRLVARGTPGGRVKLTYVARVAFFLSALIAWWTPQLAIAIPFFLIGGYLVGATGPLTEAMTIDVVVAQLRGQAVGLRTALRAAGVALGPLVLSVLSDIYGLRQGLFILTPFMLVAAFLTMLATRSYHRDYELAQLEAVRQNALEQRELAVSPSLVPSVAPSEERELSGLY